MLQLTTLLRSFGNAGAVANVRSVLEARVQDERVVDGLLGRLEPALPAASPAPARPAAAAA